MYKTIFVINIIIHMCLQHSNLCELSPEISCVLYIGFFWDTIHSRHKLCAYRILIVGSETFEGIYFEKYSEGLRYC